jgi:hypothetical protein
MIVNRGKHPALPALPAPADFIEVREVLEVQDKKCE